MWNPTTIRRFVKSYPTSTNVIRVDTDAGECYLKTMGNPEGPHVLACVSGDPLAESTVWPAKDADPAAIRCAGLGIHRAATNRD
jgi:hypothetical protein